MPEKLTQESFIEKSKNLYGEFTYDYSMTKFLERFSSVSMRCVKHDYEFQVTSASHINQNSHCPKCMLEKEQERRKQIFIKRAKKVHGDKYLYADMFYIDNRTTITPRCRSHGEFPVHPGAHTNGAGCPSCLKENTHKATVEKSIALFLKTASSIFNNLYSYPKIEQEYIDRHSEITCVCICHGEFKKNWGRHLLEKQGCPKCKRRVKIDREFSLTIDKFIMRARQKHGDLYLYDRVHESIKNNTRSLSWIGCRIHGYFKQNRYAHAVSGYGCKKCADIAKGISQRMTEHEFLKRANKKFKNKFDYSPMTYIDQYTEIEYFCYTHGKQKQTPCNHLASKFGCTICSGGGTSTTEKKVIEWMSSLTTCLPNRRDIIKRTELDAYAPEFKFAVEVDGAHWHSERHRKDENYHIQKTLKCKDIGIHLLHFWCFEVDNKFAIIASMLQYKCQQSTRVYARRLRIIQLVQAEAKQFFETNHLFGYSLSDTHIALQSTKTGRIACCMTFKKERGYVEMTGFCNHLGISVIGGASRLLKAYERKYKPKKLRTFGDIRITYGHLYKALGMTFIKRNPAKYFWVKGERRLPSNVTKDMLPKSKKFNFHDSLSIEENLLKHNYSRTYDCGHLVFEKSYV